MTQFKGIFQVTKRKYDAMLDSEKSGYLFLVRQGDYVSEDVDAKLVESSATKPEIYFGKRKYATNNDAFIDNVVATFGGLMDVDGGFILPTGDNFVNIDESGVDSLLDLFKAVDTAISTITAKFDNYYTESEIDAKVKTLNDAIAKCLTAVSVKVGDTTVGLDENGQINLTEVFNAAGKVKGVAVDGTPIELDEDGIANIVGKANVSDITALDGRLDILEAIRHAADVVYNPETKYINLKDSEGNVLGTGFDAAPFIVDGMLKEVDFVKDSEDKATSTLRFTFNADGEDKTIDVDFSKYVDTYHADDTSIELDSTTNTFSVKEVESAKVQVNTIPVGGTPLADILTAKGINSIDGNNLQSVLESLFSQNLWAEEPARTIPSSLTVSMDKPSISYDKTGTLEVGTTVKLSASAKTATASATLSYSGFDYGYSLENDNTKDGDTPASVSITGTKDSSSDYKLTFVTNNGFGGVDVPDVNGSSTSDNELIVAEGTNKVTVTASSPTFTATVPAQSKIYACSSLKKTDEEHVVNASSESTIKGAVKTNTNNASVTGAYYAFVGFSDTLPKTNDEYRAFIGNSYSRLGKGSVSSGTCNKTYMAVCVPSGWDFTCNTSLGADMRSSFTETGDVTITLPDNTTKAYKYYALTYKDGAFKDLVIK